MKYFDLGPLIPQIILSPKRLIGSGQDEILYIAETMCLL